MSTSPPGTHHQIKRKPPPPLDLSGRYPSPDPSDPFAPLWALRNRTTSGLESDIVDRARSASYLYSSTTAQVPVNTAFSPISSESGPLAFQPDLLYRQRPAHRHTNGRYPPRTYDLNDSGTESDANSVPPPVVPNTAFVQPIRTPSSNYRFPKPSLLKKAGFLSNVNGATGNRSSTAAFKQARKSTMSPPLISPAVTWIPSRVDSDFINSRSISKFTTSLPADLLDCGSLTLASDENHHQHHHNKKHLIPSDGKKDLKQVLPRPCQHSSISNSPKMLRKSRISSSRPFSFTTAPPTHSSSTFSYVHISMPTLIPSSPQPEAAYTSPRKAPAPPPVHASTLQGHECPDKSCGFGYNCIHSISSEWGLPSLLQLNYASRLPITGEDGKQITFGSLFESQPTIVIFIRHFWCPLCQDYMSSVNSSIGPKMICNSCENGHRDIKGFALGLDDGTRVRFVVISNGAHGMIAKYRQIFGLPFKVYTDPSLALYQALGMGRDGDIKHHCNQQIHKHSTSVGSISEKNSDISKPGEYVKHSLMGGIAMVVLRAFKVGMPVWEKGGDVNQLGGEFVFGPGLTCTYAHRMQTTKGHAPIQDVLKAAGILAKSTSNRTPSSAEVRRGKPLLPTGPDWTTSLTGSGAKERRRRESMHTTRDNESSIQSHATTKASRRRYSIGMMSLEDEDRWMEYRHDSIERLRARKDVRRGISRIGSESHWSRQPLEMGDIIGDHRRTRSDFTTAKTGRAF